MDLDYSSEKRLGDIRQVWELNRHQYFVTLGKAYWITSDEKYASEFVNQLADWITKNPYGYGINWLHSQEAAIRAVSWIWAFYLFSDFTGFDVEKEIVMLKSLYQHAEYTLWNLSDSPVTNNHLISEACGLAIIGIMFPEFRNAKKWRDIGIRIFEREAVKQIWEDGVSGELSTNYHCFVLDSFLELSILMKKNGYMVPEDVDKRIEKMIEYVMYLCKPDGAIPNLGDFDSGRAFRLSEYKTDDKRGYLSAGAALYHRGDFKKIARRFYEEAFWLLGAEGLKAFKGIEERYPRASSKLFKPSGIAILRNDWNEGSDYLVFRGGPTELRKGVSIGHNHADSLSFELYTDGKTVIVDPGTYLYSLDDRWRHYFRKTMSHNTVSIDGEDQANVSQRFGVADFPLSKVHHFSSNRYFDYIDMSHEGYMCSGVAHRRKIIWVKKGYFLIVDEIRGKGIHRVDSYFNIDQESISLDDNCKTVNIVNNDGRPFISIMPAFPNTLKLDIPRGEVDPILGWASHQYGEKHPLLVARYSLKKELPIIFCFLISIKTMEKIFVKNFSWKNLTYKITVQVANSTDEICLNSRGDIAFYQQYDTLGELNREREGYQL